MTDALDLITCPACGAPVPLAADSPAPCVSCGQLVELPDAHLALHRQSLEGASRLAEADAIWRDLPPPMPAWIPGAFVALTVVGVTVLVVLWAAFFMQAIGGPGRGFVVFVLAPSFLAVQLGLELLAWWSPFTRLEREFSATRDARFTDLARCRRCGAPLAAHAAAITVRCPYCRADNLVRHLRPAAHQEAREKVEQGRREIGAALATLQMLKLQRKIMRFVGPAVMLPVFAVFAVLLWSQ